LQARVRAATGLDATVGIGRNRLQAKLATGFGKPAGVYRLTSANWDEVMGGRPTDALWGIGAKTAAKLAELGIGTVRELAAADPSVLAARFGPQTGPWLVGLARGEGSSEVDAEPWVARSRSKETTFQRDLADWGQVEAAVAGMARQLAAELAGERWLVARVVVKIRYVPFFTKTKGVTLGEPGRAAEVVEPGAAAALALFTDHRPVRLAGVRAEFARRASPSG
jgi:DNA polymerase-4